MGQLQHSPTAIFASDFLLRCVHAPGLQYLSPGDPDELRAARPRQTAPPRLAQWTQKTDPGKTTILVIMST